MKPNEQKREPIAFAEQMRSAKLVEIHGKNDAGWSKDNTDLLLTLLKLMLLLRLLQPLLGLCSVGITLIVEGDEPFVDHDEL